MAEVTRHPDQHSRIGGNAGALLEREVQSVEDDTMRHWIGIGKIRHLWGRISRAACAPLASRVLSYGQSRPSGEESALSRRLTAEPVGGVRTTRSFSGNARSEKNTGPRSPVGRLRPADSFPPPP